LRARYGGVLLDDRLHEFDWLDVAAIDQAGLQAKAFELRCNVSSGYEFVRTRAATPSQSIAGEKHLVGAYPLGLYLPSGRVLAQGRDRYRCADEDRDESRGFKHSPQYKGRQPADADPGPLREKI
jgi:hypothetical protein